METKHYHLQWDETMVIVVMAGAALCLLILLASYVHITGQAAAATLHPQALREKFNKAIVISGEGSTFCLSQCRQQQRQCVTAYNNDHLTYCSTETTGRYSCLCA